MPTTKMIPNDGRWHSVPARQASAPTLPTVQMDIDVSGYVTVRNTGPAPVEVTYEVQD